MMRPQQQTFEGFDIFDMGGFTRSTVEDHETAKRKAEQERRFAEDCRKARERAEEAKRQAKAEREERRQRERAEEQAQRERDRNRQRTYRHTAAFDPYTVLGVNYRASSAEIRAAWVRLCRQHHPDLGGDAEQMKQVNRAYEMLKARAA